MADTTQQDKPPVLDLREFQQIEFVVNPSMIRPILGTIAALFAFGSAFMLTVIHYLSARDFVGLWVYLQTNDVATGLTQIAAAGVLIWRLIVTQRRKKRENRLVSTSSVAIHTTDPVAVPVPAESVAAPPEFEVVPAGSVYRALAREPATRAFPISEGSSK